METSPSLRFRPAVLSESVTLQDMTLSTPPVVGLHTACGMPRLISEASSRRRITIFNPRKQRWAEHFVWSDDFTLLVGLTPTGRATVATLQMNQQKMVNLRRLLGLAGLHP